MRKILFNQDSSGGAGGSPSGQSTEPTTVVAAAPPAVAPTVRSPESGVQSPPAARTVATGEITEETLRLRETVSTKDAEMEALKKQLKLHEITISEYQDKLHAITSPANVPIKQKQQPKARGITAGVFFSPED